MPTRRAQQLPAPRGKQRGRAATRRGTQAKRSTLRWSPSGSEHPGRLEATLGYFVLDVEPAENVMVQDGSGRWERDKGRAGWVVSVDDGIADPSVPGTFDSVEEAKAEAERIARYTLARRPDRERGTPGYARGAIRKRPEPATRGPGASRRKRNGVFDFPAPREPDGRAEATGWAIFRRMKSDPQAWADLRRRLRDPRTTQATAQRAVLSKARAAARDLVVEDEVDRAGDHELAYAVGIVMRELWVEHSPKRNDAEGTWRSPESELLYRTVRVPGGVRAEVWWAGAFRGVRDHGRTSLDRIARSGEEAVAGSRAEALARVTAFDRVFLGDVDAKRNGIDIPITDPKRRRLMEGRNVSITDVSGRGGTRVLRVSADGAPLGEYASPREAFVALDERLAAQAGRSRRRLR